MPPNLPDQPVSPTGQHFASYEMNRAGTAAMPRPPQPVGETASPAAVLRAAQKDASFLALLRSAVADVLHQTMGGRWWVQHHQSVAVVTDLLYSGLTTLSLRQTLGEEYTGLLQVNTSRTGLPTALTRHIMVYLHCFGPPIVQHCLRRLDASLSRGGALRAYLRPELTTAAHNYALPALKKVVTVVQRAHLALFYIQGLFYHLSKRMTGVKHVSIRRWLNDNSSNGSLRLLGRLTLLQLLLQLLLYMRQLYIKRRAAATLKHEKDTAWSAEATGEEDQKSSVYVAPTEQCTLCLEQRQQPALARCGHVFCYTCLHTALATSGHYCPLCRYPCEPREVVPLVNYK